jgi:hypothetical protein
MASVYEIIQGINQAAANGAWDGAHSADLAADGKARSAGLKREDGHFINDRRVMDGFNVRFMGPVLRLSYQSEVRIKEVKNNNFEDEVVARLQEIVKFLKKEYKVVTGDSLALTLEGEHHIRVERISNYRTNLLAHCDYRIGGLKDVVEVNNGSDEGRLDSAIKDWLSLGPKGRAKNDTR